MDINLQTQESPDITNTLTGNITTSINQLRSFSTALSAFITTYDDLHTHINFISSSIDSILPRHLVDTANNPSLLNKVRLLESCCDHTINGLPDVILLERNPRESVSDRERSHESVTTPDSTYLLHNYEGIDVSNNHLEGVDVSKNYVETDDLNNKLEVVVVLNNFEETDVRKNHLEIDNMNNKLEVADVSNNKLEVADVSNNKLEVVDVSKNCEEINVSENHVEINNLNNKLEVVDVSNKSEEIDVFENHVENDNLNNNLEVVDVSNTCEEIDVSKNHEETDNLNNKFEVVDVSNYCEEIVVSKNHEETDTSNNKFEVVDVSNCCEETDVCKNHVETDTSNNKLEVVDVLNSSEEIDVSENRIEIDTLKTFDSTNLLHNYGGIDASNKLEVVKNFEEIDVLMNILKKQEEMVTETFVAEAVVSEQNPNRMAANGEQSHEHVRTPESLKEIDVSKKLEENNILKKSEQADTLKKNKKTGNRNKDKETGTLNKFAMKLQFLCKNMSSKGIRRHVAAHLSETYDLREEIAKALKLAKDPAKLVLNCTGMFFGQDSSAFCKDSGSDQNKQNAGRLASVLLLECFVMISSDDGIEIAKKDHECAAKYAVIWRRRMIREGGVGHTDEVDARGLLLLISGFGIQDHVFKIQDIMDLVRASNVKGISTALRRSFFLVPKIPEVINLMVKNNLETESVDMAYTFGLKKLEVVDVSKNCEGIDVSKNPVEIDTSNNMLEVVDMSKNCEEIDVSENPVEVDTLKKQEESVTETFGDQTIGVVSEQNPGGMATNGEQSHEIVASTGSLELEEINVLNKPEEDILKKTEELDTLMITEEIDTWKKNEEAVPETCCDQATPAVSVAIVSEQSSNGFAANCYPSYENVRAPDMLNKPKEVGILKNHELADGCKNPEEAAVLKKHGEIEASMIPEDIDASTNREEFYTLNNREKIDISKNQEEIDTSVIPEEVDTSKKTQETVPETSCDQTTPAVQEAIVSEQNPNGMATNREQSHENALKKPAVIDISKMPEQTDVLKKPEEIVILKNSEQTDICKNPEEPVVLKKRKKRTRTFKKAEETVPETSCDQITPVVPEAIVSEQNPNRMATNREESHENVLKKPAVTDISKKPKQTDILNKPEQIDICKNPEVTVVLKKRKRNKKTGILKKAEENETSEKSVVSVLQSICQSMSPKQLKRHVATHFSEMINLREEIVKALKLAKDPAKLVLRSIGRFFVQGSGTFCKPPPNTENLGRMAAILILECFVMISSDGIEIAKNDRENAAQTAVDWKKRMIREGGPKPTDEVDARGLLLLISGFGIQDHVFKIPDIMDLIRASNVKGISTALCRSAFLIPRVPWVVYLMVKSNLEVEAIDIAYTFGLEDVCHPQDILTEYLDNKIKDFQNSSSFQMLEAVEEHLFDLKSVKQCLESHNVDPSTLLPNFKINEKIQNLENEVNKWKLIQKRKSLENPIQQEAKRVCFGHENMPRQQRPVDYDGMIEVNRSTHMSTNHFDSDPNPGNSYINNHSASSVYNASAMPENIPGPVPNSQAGGFHGSYDQMVHMAEVQPYGLERAI